MGSDVVTVDCVNSDRCGGRVTLRLGGPSSIAATGAADVKTGGWERVAQTCGCRYSEQEVFDLYDRADRECGRV